MSQTNWANRQKEALAAVSAKPELKRVGNTAGGGEILAFYGFNAPEPGTKRRQLNPGDITEGVYKGSPRSKTYDKPFHKIQTAEGLIALPSAGQLDKALAAVAEGADVKVVYIGKKKIESGKYAGKPAHTFEVFASAFKEGV